jgi:hypothetical protein
MGVDYEGDSRIGGERVSFYSFVKLTSFLPSSLNLLQRCKANKPGKIASGFMP